MEIVQKVMDNRQKIALGAIFKKNRHNFYHNSRASKPNYSLKFDSSGDFAINKYSNLPVILHNKYQKSSGNLIESREVVYEEILPKILDGIHKTSTLDGSQCCVPMGVNAMNKTFGDRFFYKGIFKQISKYLKNCKSCRINTPLPMTQAAPPKPIRTHWPHERIQYDIIDMAPSKKRSFMKENQWGFRYILTIKCCFSKFCWLFPLKRKTAAEVYKIVKFLFDIEGPPEILQSDNGKEFVNKLIKELSQHFGFKMIQGKPYTPQHQGQVERLNKTVKAYLSRLLQNFSLKDQGEKWPILLPGIANQINKSYHSTINDIPFRIYRNRDVPSLDFKSNIAESTISEWLP